MMTQNGCENCEKEYGILRWNDNVWIEYAIAILFNSLVESMQTCGLSAGDWRYRERCEICHFVILETKKCTFGTMIVYDFYSVLSQCYSLSMCIYAMSIFGRITNYKPCFLILIKKNHNFDVEQTFECLQAKFSTAPFFRRHLCRMFSTIKCRFSIKIISSNSTTSTHFMFQICWDNINAVITNCLSVLT